VKVVWSPLAIERAAEAASYIARDRPGAAARWIGELFALVGTLKEHPERGRWLPELDRPDLRELVYGNYRVIYRVEPRRVSVLTVRHGRRLLDSSELAERS
jgi:plasmid stabilization system protein ParE